MKTDARQRKLLKTRARRTERRQSKREEPLKPGEVRINTSYPQGTGRIRPPRSVLEGVQTARLPRAEAYRTYWGRSLDLVRIEMAIRGAHCGMMRLMTDLGRETLTLDGHATGVLQKRINRVGSLPWRLDEASGAGVDTELAEECRREVEIQLKMIPGFKRKLKQLAWGVYDGRAVLEVEWLFNPTMAWPWRVKNLHWIHPRRVGFGSQRQLQIIDSTREYSDFVDAGVQLDSVPFKYVHHTPQLFNDYPEREGLLPRILYWSFFSRFGVRERMILLEVFGKPWRIGYVENAAESPVNDEDIEDAFDQLDALGGTSTAVLPKGLRADVPSPEQGAGQVHDQAIEHAQLIISKLVLGSTSTTDAQPAGLGSNQADVHKTEEDLIVETDGEDLADAVEDSLTDAIVVLNRGPQNVINAPVFRIAPEERADPKLELENINGAVSVGVPVALAEARERTGFRELNEGEPYLSRVTRPATLGAPSPAPQFEVVWPQGKAPPAGTLQPAPSEPLDPLDIDEPTEPAPPPETPPAADIGEADEAELEERRALAAAMTEGQVRHCEHGRANKCDFCGVERARELELADDGSPNWRVIWRAVGDRPKAEPKELEVPKGAPPLTASFKQLGKARLLANRKASFQGIPLVIDRPKGTVQKGTDREGNEWERTYTVDYGYIPKTDGGDGEALDVFVGDSPESETVYWVRQVIDNKFDEYKLFLGFSDATEAHLTYVNHIPPAFWGGITMTSLDQLKALLGIKPSSEGYALSARLNTSGATECPHGKRRKCVDCGIVKSRQGAPWRALK